MEQVQSLMQCRGYTELQQGDAFHAVNADLESIYIIAMVTTEGYIP